MERLRLKKIFYTYHLVDSRDNLPFYVGKGYGKRMYKHERKVERNVIPNNNKHLYYKIKQILENKNIIIYKKVLENVTHEKACKKEIEEIKKYGRRDTKTGILCNLTDGGEGAYGRIVSEETKRKLKESHRGQISGFKGWRHTEESNRNNRESQIKRFKDPEERKRTSETTRVGMYSSGHINRISKSIILKSPLGEIVTFKNISLFCRTYSLTNANIYKVLREKITNHKGWTLPNHIKKK